MSLYPPCLCKTYLSYIKVILALIKIHKVDAVYAFTIYFDMSFFMVFITHCFVLDFLAELNILLTVATV